MEKDAAGNYIYPSEIKDDDPAIPCGLVAKSVFNDTYTLWKIKDEKDEVITPVQIDILESNIAWSSDIEYKFANI